MQYKAGEELCVRQDKAFFFFFPRLFLSPLSFRWQRATYSKTRIQYWFNFIPEIGVSFVLLFSFNDRFPSKIREKCLKQEERRKTFQDPSSTSRRGTKIEEKKERGKPSSLSHIKAWGSRRSRRRSRSHYGATQRWWKIKGKVWERRGERRGGGIEAMAAIGTVFTVGDIREPPLFSRPQIGKRAWYYFLLVAQFTIFGGKVTALSSFFLFHPPEILARRFLGPMALKRIFCVRFYLKIWRKRKLICQTTASATHTQKCIKLNSWRHAGTPQLDHC